MADTKVAKPVNYTAEQTAEMVAKYVANKGDQTVAEIAAAMGKSVRSVIAKLSREGVYEKKTYTNKNGAKPVKKDSVAEAIGKVLRLTESEVDSLTKANKSALDKIFKALAESKPIDSEEE